MRVIFVSNNWDDAHQQTRLTGICEQGVEVVSMGFKRNYYPGQSKSVPIWLGSMKHRSYFTRLATYLAYAVHLFRIVRKSDWVYVYGFDVFAITCIVKFFKGFRIAHEIPDIQQAFLKPGLAGRFLRVIESATIPSADLIIPTSEAFVKEYFAKIRKINISHYLVIENKIHAEHLPEPAERTHSTDRKIRIGYFGLLRCTYTLNYLLQLAESGKFEVILRGIFMPQTYAHEQAIRNSGAISHEGPFKAEQDLKNMYENIDICWAAYPFSTQRTGNHLWARTNRYYESMFFRCPMILQTGSADHRHALKENIKVLNLDVSEAEALSFEFENLLTREFLREAGHSMRTVPKSDYTITDEYSKLMTCLMQRK